MSDPSFRVILADPPWAYQNWTEAKNGAAATAYADGTMSPADLALIPVSRWAHPKGSIMAMWTTWPQMAAALELARSWGPWEYVSGLPWIKTVPSSGGIARGTGFWTMASSEMLLFFRRGKIALDFKGAGLNGPPLGLLHGPRDEPVFWSPAPRRHSEKPLGLHEFLERLTRSRGPYLELFAREARPGWTCWGGDLGFILGPEGVTEREPALLPLFDQPNT